MELKNISPDFLKEAAKIFESYGNGNITYDTLGFLFSDYFQEAMYQKWLENPDEFLKLQSIITDH